MARDLAESPSVRMSVHFCDCAVPALLASSSFGIPVIRDFLAAPSVFASCFISLNLDKERSSSCMPVLRTFLKKVLVGGSNFDPKDTGLEVHSFFICDEKVGFSKVARTKSMKVFFTCVPVNFILLFISSMRPWAMMFATASTWVLPFVVQIPLTKLTWLNPSGLAPMHTAHRSVSA